LSSNWSNKTRMGRVNQIKVKVQSDVNVKPTVYSFASRDRLNVNDLMKKRQDEKKVDKKTNILIFSGVTAVAAVVLVILSL